MKAISLYQMGQEILEAKRAYKEGGYNTESLDGELYDEYIMELEQEYIKACKLYNDYDENDPVLH